MLPLKRTRLKTNPEEAEHYRKYREDVLAALSKGFPQDQIRKELATKGVPDRIAERIVVAAELELSAAEKPEDTPTKLVWWSVSFALFILGLDGGYLLWRLSQATQISPGNLLPLIAVAVGCLGYVGRRLWRLKR
jgi:hypothetical protein